MNIMSLPNSRTCLFCCHRPSEGLRMLLLVTVVAAAVGVERRVVAGDVALVEDRRRRRQAAGQRQLAGQVHGDDALGVDAAVVQRSRLRVMVDVAAVVTEAQAAAYGEDAVLDRHVDVGRTEVVRAAVPGPGDVAGDLAAEFVQVGRFGKVADRAAFRAVAPERALRPAQHLDAIEVVEAGQGRTGVEEVLGRDRDVVQIQTHRGRPGSGADPADHHVGEASGAPGRVECHSGYRPGDVVEALDPLRLDVLGAHHRHADGHVLDVLRASLCGDDHGIERRAGRRAGRRGVGGGIGRAVAGGVGRGGLRRARGPVRQRQAAQCQRAGGERLPAGKWDGTELHSVSLLCEMPDTHRIGALRPPWDRPRAADGPGAATAPRHSISRAFVPPCIRALRPASPDGGTLQHATAPRMARPSPQDRTASLGPGACACQQWQAGTLDAHFPQLRSNYRACRRGKAARCRRAAESHCETERCRCGRGERSWAHASVSGPRRAARRAARFNVVRVAAGLPADGSATRPRRWARASAAPAPGSCASRHGC